MAGRAPSELGKSGASVGVRVEFGVHSGHAGEISAWRLRTEIWSIGDGQGVDLCTLRFIHSCVSSFYHLWDDACLFSTYWAKCSPHNPLSRGASCPALCVTELHLWAELGARVRRRG